MKKLLTLLIVDKYFCKYFFSFQPGRAYKKWKSGRLAIKYNHRYIIETKHEKLHFSKRSYYEAAKRGYNDIIAMLIEKNIPGFFSNVYAGAYAGNQSQILRWFCRMEPNKFVIKKAVQNSSYENVMKIIDKIPENHTSVYWACNNRDPQVFNHMYNRFFTEGSSPFRWTLYIVHALNHKNLPLLKTFDIQEVMYREPYSIVDIEYTLWNTSIECRKYIFQNQPVLLELDYNGVSFNYCSDDYKRHRPIKCIENFIHECGKDGIEITTKKHQTMSKLFNSLQKKYPNRKFWKDSRDKWRIV